MEIKTCGGKSKNWVVLVGVVAFGGARRREKGEAMG